MYCIIASQQSDLKHLLKAFFPHLTAVLEVESASCEYRAADQRANCHFDCCIVKTLSTHCTATSQSVPILQSSP